MTGKRLLLGLFALGLVGVGLSGVLGAVESGRSRKTFEPGECPPGQSCDWCVFEVTKVEGSDCPRLRKICLLCEEGESACPAVEHIAIGDRDCRLTIESESERCAACPRGVPTFVGP